MSRLEQATPEGLSTCATTAECEDEAVSTAASEATTKIRARPRLVQVKGKASSVTSSENVVPSEAMSQTGYEDLAPAKFKAMLTVAALNTFESFARRKYKDKTAHWASITNWERAISLLSNAGLDVVVLPNKSSVQYRAMRKIFSATKAAAEVDAKSNPLDLSLFEQWGESTSLIVCLATVKSLIMQVRNGPALKGLPIQYPLVVGVPN